MLDLHPPRSPPRCTMRDRASLKVIEEEAGIGVYPRGHANPHAPIMDGGSAKAKSLSPIVHHFSPIIFLSKDEGQREWGKRKERVKFTVLVYD